VGRRAERGHQTGAWDAASVRIEADGKPLPQVVLFLARGEANELRDGIDDLLTHFGEEGWHTHVASADYQVEITIVPEVPTGS
jgi:hypothetical protein